MFHRSPKVVAVAVGLFVVLLFLSSFRQPPDGPRTAAYRVDRRTEHVPSTSSASASTSIRRRTSFPDQAEGVTARFKNGAGYLQPLQSGSVLDGRAIVIAAFTKAWSAHSTGGLGKHADQLYRSLARRGHTVHVFTSRLRKEREMDVEESGRLVVHYSQGGLWGAVSKEFYDQHLETFKKIHSATPFSVIHQESVALRLNDYEPFGLEVVSSWHGVLVDVFRETLLNALLNGKTRDPSVEDKVAELGKMVLHQSQTFQDYIMHHVVLTERAAEDLIRMYNVPEQRISVVHIGMRVDQFQPSPAARTAFRNTHSIPQSAVVFGFAGQLVELKGVPLLVEAIQPIMEAHPSVFIVIAGSGPLKSALETKAHLFPGRVVLLGVVSAAEMPDFFSAIDVFLDLTTHQTGSNGVLVEAALSDAVLIATNVGGVGTTNIPSPQHGMMIQPGNLEQLLARVQAVVRGDVDLAAMAAVAREHARQRFDLEATVDLYETLLVSLASK